MTHTVMFCLHDLVSMVYYAKTKDTKAISLYSINKHTLYVTRLKTTPFGARVQIRGKSSNVRLSTNCTDIIILKAVYQMLPSSNTYVSIKGLYGFREGRTGVSVTVHGLKN